jgi:hypothetical protein
LNAIAGDGTLPDKAKNRQRLLLGAILACLAFQAWLNVSLSINWDEFRFLADVHLLARGELTENVQTFHTHFFAWLLWLPGDEIDQIVVARFVMLALEAGTCALIFLCARRHAGAEASLFAVLCYLTFSYVMRHGASFRFDPPSTFLMMAATALIATGRLRYLEMMAAGLLVALGAMVTIKSVFFVPTIATLALGRVVEAEDKRDTLIRLGSSGLAGVTALALLYLYHSSFIASGSLHAAQAMISGSLDKTIGQSHLMPGLIWLTRSLLESPLNWLALIGGIAVVAQAPWRRPHPKSWPAAVGLLSFALPLSTLLFYRNAFPYYYAFILAPASVIVAPFAEQLAKRVNLPLVAALLFAIGVVKNLAPFSPVLGAQRMTLDAVHRIFPEPVDYIDRCSMVASSRKHGFFMSSWGTEVYRDAGRPVMKDILVRERPPLLLVNSPIIASALADDGADPRMLPEDATTLRENFIPHWGAVWVAGKRLAVTTEPTNFQMLIAGRYTLEAEAPVSIDGNLYQPGEVVRLGSGEHRAESAQGHTFTLRWGDHLYRPDMPPPRSGLFDDF